LGTPDLDTLKSTLVNNNADAGWCTVAVFAGLLVEYTILLWPKWRELKRWERIFTVVAGIAIAGGVYGEYWFGSRAADAALQIENLSEKRVAELKADAAALNAKAAGLTKEAEDERAARVEAEEAIAWRRLTPSNRQKLRLELSPFTLNRTWFQYHDNDVEAFNFGHDLATSVPASWKPTEPMPVLSFRAGPFPLGTNGPLERGIRIAVVGDKSYENAANALTKLLSSFGFDCKRSDTGLVGDPKYAPMIIVSVEPRPEGLQGEAKLRAEVRRRQAKNSQSAKP
jgi:hypothetical protein